jgi:hypothetical protein
LGKPCQLSPESSLYGQMVSFRLEAHQWVPNDQNGSKDKDGASAMTRTPQQPTGGDFQA